VAQFDEITTIVHRRAIDNVSPEFQKLQCLARRLADPCTRSTTLLVVEGLPIVCVVPSVVEDSTNH
jgi:hypothetical protein